MHSKLSEPPLEARQVTKSSNSPLLGMLPREAEFTGLEKWFIFQSQFIFDIILY